MNVPPKLMLVLKAAALCGAFALAGTVAADSAKEKKGGAAPQVKEAAEGTPTPQPISPRYCPPCGMG